jgi:hypothetical protein
MEGFFAAGCMRQKIIEQARSKPQRILIFIVIAVVFLLYSQRLFNITNQYYSTGVAVLIIAIASIIMLSTFLHILNITDNANVSNFNNVFNSPGSRSFFAIIVLVLFIMFLYEVPIYSNNDPHLASDKLMFGHNSIFSNRTVGMILLFTFTIVTGYTVYSTTREA